MCFLSCCRCPKTFHCVWYILISAHINIYPSAPSSPFFLNTLHSIFSMQYSDDMGEAVLSCTDFIHSRVSLQYFVNPNFVSIPPKSIPYFLSCALPLWLILSHGLDIVRTVPQQNPWFQLATWHPEHQWPWAPAPPSASLETLWMLQDLPLLL